MRERTIERYTRDEIAKLGGTMEKFVSPGIVGRPDDLVCWPERSPQAMGLSDGSYCPMVEFIEFKAPGKTTRRLQEIDHAKRRKMGFDVHVIHTMDEANAYLKSRGMKDTLGLPGNRSRAKK